MNFWLRKQKMLHRIMFSEYKKSCTCTILCFAKKTVDQKVQ